MGDILEIAGTLVGIIYLILEYRANKWLWIAGMIMPAIYIFVCYDAGLYADLGINVYYLIASFYGIAMWKFGNKEKEAEPPITRMPQQGYLKGSAMFAISFAAIAWILYSYTDSDVVIADTFTTSLSITGMWMLARKYVEQWLAWIAVDVVSSFLYIYKGLYFTSALYALYAIIAIFGYFNWLKLKEQQNEHHRP